MLCAFFWQAECLPRGGGEKSNPELPDALPMVVCVVLDFFQHKFEESSTGEPGERG